MSAFLVSNDHLSMIITWTIHEEGGSRDLIPQDWFREFYLENVKSLQYRYPDSYQELIYWNLDHHGYLPDFNATEPRALKTEIAIAILKLIDCWEYQSCEHHFDSSATPWRMMAQIKELALQVSGYTPHEDSQNFYRNSQIYELAPWEYSKQEWQAFKTAMLDLKAIPTS
jgi:hypothetical protein